MFWSTFAHANSLMPVQGSTFAENVDSLYKFLVYASFISCVLVIGGMVYFAYKYRRQGQKSAYISHNVWAEFLWSFIPFVIFMVVFGWGWYVYHNIRTAPKDAFEVHVVGSQWSWNFQYKSGRTSSKELYVPVNKPIRLIMSSTDVIHSFYIPAFRTKQDVVPGRYTTMWFEATKMGEFNVFCAEFCGKDHSAMLATIHVVSQEEFDQWLMNDPFKGLTLAQIGEKTYMNRCKTCHSIDISNSEGKKSDAQIAPGWKGLFGNARTFADGSTATADENYIRESILNPAKKIVKSFPNAMTPFQGNITEQEITGIIEYMKTLK